MARSYRHTPIHGNGADSEKQCKRIGNRKLRRRHKMQLHKALQDDTIDDTCFAVMDEVMNPWAMSKDGKSYWAYPDKSSVYISLWSWSKRYAHETLQEYIERELEELREDWRKFMRK